MSNRVSSRLQDNHATHEPMGKVEGIERDGEKTNEGVIPSCEQEKGDLSSVSIPSTLRDAGRWRGRRTVSYHVDDCQVPCPITEAPSRRFKLGKVDIDQAKSNVGGKVAKKQKQLQSGRKGANIDGRAKLYFPVVPYSKYRRIQDAPLEEGELRGCNSEILLLPVVEASDCPDVPLHKYTNPPGQENSTHTANGDDEIFGESQVLHGCQSFLGAASAMATRRATPTAACLGF